MCFPRFSVGQDVSWVGILCCVSSLSVSVFGPDVVLNQRQVFIVVSDWEPYLGSLFCHCGLWVIVYV